MGGKDGRFLGVWLQLNVEIYADPSRQMDQCVLRGSSVRGDESSGCGKYIGGGGYVEWREWVTPIHSLNWTPKQTLGHLPKVFLFSPQKGSLHNDVTQNHS